MSLAYLENAVVVQFGGGKVRGRERKRRGGWGGKRGLKESKVE